MADPGFFKPRKEWWRQPNDFMNLSIGPASTPVTRKPSGYKSDKPQQNYVDPIFGRAGSARSVKSAPPSVASSTGTPGLIRLPSVAPLPSFGFHTAGQSVEQQRLADLSARIQQWSNMPIPTERGLPPLAAIAAGALGALAPDRAAMLQPEIDRYRQMPVADFIRQHDVQAQRFGVESQMIGQQAEASERQMNREQTMQGVNQIMRNAQTIITGASEAARQLVESQNPADQAAGKEVMRRVLMLRELVSGAMEADPNSLGDQFVKSAMGEITDIGNLLNAQRGLDAEQQMAMERLKQQHTYRMEEAQFAGKMALERTLLASQVRAMQISRTTQNAYIKEHADNYLLISQYLPILDRLYALQKMGVGGPVAGGMGGFGPGGALRVEFNRLASELKRTLLFGPGGKALTPTERNELDATVPDVWTWETTQASQIQGARNVLYRALERMEAAAQIYGYDPTILKSAGAGLASGPANVSPYGAQLPPGVVPTGGTIDGSLFGLTDDGGEE
jgi:hypothetical protein